MTDSSKDATVGPDGGASQLLGLFAPPPPPTGGEDDDNDNADPSSQSADGRLSTGDGDDGGGNTTEQEDTISEKPPNDEDQDDSEQDQNHSQSPVDAGSVSHFMALFAPPASAVPRPAQLTARQSTAPRSNRRADRNNGEQTPLLGADEGESSFSSITGKPSGAGHGKSDSWFDFLLSSPTAETPKTSVSSRKTIGGDNVGVASRRQPSSHLHSRIPSAALPSIDESNRQSGPYNHSTATTTTTGTPADSSRVGKLTNLLQTIGKECLQPSTYIGSFMFLLYHVVFCLANGSAILRPQSTVSILGLMTKTASLGVITASAVYWIGLGGDVPALYPTSDLFLAPFLANLAAIVDETLAADNNITPAENDIVFLTTFGILTAIGIMWSGTLLTLAGVFKLANMGSYLPFPVICGFFSAVGILTWTLAVTVDTGGHKIGQVLFSGDTELLKYFVVHHTPSVIVAVIMKYLGPKNPFYVIMVVFATIGSVYAVMFVCGVSLDEAKEMGWFWSHNDLVYKNADSVIGFDSWSPPAPFGVIREAFNGRIHWGAIKNGMSTTIAMGFLYLVRCSVHGTALKKNIPNLSRTVKEDHPAAIAMMEANPPSPKPAAGSRWPPPAKSRKFSEAVDIEAVMEQPANATVANGDGKPAGVVIHAKPTNIPLKDILLRYGYSQFVVTLVGGFAITPSVAASPTMFTLGAEKIAPQVGAVILLLGFYLTDFQLVGYVPKPAFSCLLVLAFIDMTITWCYRSWFKTKDKSEWMVVPAIVICAFALDLLTAVFLGIAFSTFIFVASFFRSGVVKFVANGVTIQSTIERTFRSGEWLNQNGHFIQVVVLHNYLFFGNATSVYTYISHVFEDAESSDGTENFEDRTPKYVILDLALVTGMDTSTVDVFSDIKNLCASRKCKLFMAGMSPNLRSILALGNVKPTTGVRSKRQLRFFASLDDALGKAEDMLLESDFHGKDTMVVAGSNRRLMGSGSDKGFRTAMQHIDEQHGDSFSIMLGGLQKHTRPVELQPNERLYCDGETTDIERGLFFIEFGIMKIERGSNATLTRGGVGDSLRMSVFGGETLSKVDSVGQLSAMLDATNVGGGHGQEAKNQSFRLARIGPGWVAGTMEQVSGIRRQGEYIAVTHCRLHHLPYSKLEVIESENPALILNLYKLLSYLMARRQEATIGQLATLHSIMSSPALRGGKTKSS